MAEPTDEELRKQMVSAARASVQRTMAHPDLADFPEDVRALIAAVAVGEFMTGAGQMADYLTRLDGGVHPQDMSRAVKGAATELGMQSGKGPVWPG